jgi:hypothetical protein
MPFLIERMFLNKNVKTNLVHCQTCNFYYSEVRPTDDEMKRLYSGYRDDAYQKQREKHESEYTSEFNKNLGFSENNIHIRNTIMMDIVNEHLSPSEIKNILDFGGDCGQYIPNDFASSNRYVYEISGISPNSGIIGISNEDKLKFIKWDLIMCCHVLEHVPYPMKIIKQIISIMPINSYLYIEVPYEDYFLDILEVGNTPYIHEHINFFRNETFNSIFDTGEFTILENKYTEVKLADYQSCEKYLQCFVKKIK